MTVQLLRAGLWHASVWTHLVTIKAPVQVAPLNALPANVEARSLYGVSVSTRLGGMQSAEKYLSHSWSCMSVGLIAACLPSPAIPMDWLGSALAAGHIPTV